MFLVIIFLVTLFLLFGAFSLTALGSAFRRLHKRESKKQFKAVGSLFFYRGFHNFFFHDHEFEGVFFATICAQNIVRFGYAVCAYVFLANTSLYQHHIQQQSLYDFTWFWILLNFVAFILVGFVVGDYLPRVFGTKLPQTAFKLCTPISSIFMLLVFPVTYTFLKISHSFSRTVYFDNLQEPSAQAKQELIDIIQTTEMSPEINKQDTKLVEAVLNFRERIAREVMVPRVDVFGLSADTTIQDAAKILKNEGYSRTPVYKNTLDNIVGVLMYKDILTKYMEYIEKEYDPKILNATIETIQKNVLYTPETKKLSNLLQEFRKKQVHLAIVVDEYGGTEGIVTIEDILEEIVGDIADEYDDQEVPLLPQPDGSWIADARLSIIDAEEQLGIQIPQDGDYDTIAGYIFHKAGAIPSKGFVIHHNDFELEIIDSNDRSVEKVRIKLLTIPE